MSNRVIEGRAVSTEPWYKSYRAMMDYYKKVCEADGFYDLIYQIPPLQEGYETIIVTSLPEEEEEK